MDYQRAFGQPHDINQAYIDFGNYNYGAVAAAAGYSLLEAEFFAGLVNLGGNGPRSFLLMLISPRSSQIVNEGFKDCVGGKVAPSQ